MAESDEDMKARKLRELEGKNIAFYSTLLSAWIQTKMERDKTLVTLSAAAIGLLVTILTTGWCKSALYSFCIYCSFYRFWYLYWYFFKNLSIKFQASRK